MKTGFYSAKIASAALAVLVAFSYQSPVSADEINREAVEQIVREYLLENPNILVEMQNKLDEERLAEQAEMRKQVLSKQSAAIYDSRFNIEFGDPNAKVTIVEFFDYNCPYCSRAAQDMHKLLEANSDIRFILKEFPVLGEESVNAHRVSLAVSILKPEIYAQYHEKLLALEGRKDAARAIALAVEMGVDETALVQEMENPEIVEGIRQVYELANNLEINGTPSYIVGDEVLYGAVGYEDLAAAAKRIKQ